MQATQQQMQATLQQVQQIQATLQQVQATLQQVQATQQEHGAMQEAARANVNRRAQNRQVAHNPLFGLQPILSERAANAGQAPPHFPATHAAVHSLRAARLNAFEVPSGPHAHRPVAVQKDTA